MLKCYHAHLCTWVFQIVSTGLGGFQKWKLKIGDIISQIQCSHRSESQNISQPLLWGNWWVPTQLFIPAVSNNLSSFRAPPKLSIPVWKAQLRISSESHAAWCISQHLECDGYCRAKWVLRASNALTGFQWLTESRTGLEFLCCKMLLQYVE